MDRSFKTRFDDSSYEHSIRLSSCPAIATLQLLSTVSPSKPTRRISVDRRVIYKHLYYRARPVVGRRSPEIVRIARFTFRRRID